MANSGKTKQGDKPLIKEFLQDNQQDIDAIDAPTQTGPSDIESILRLRIQLAKTAKASEAISLQMQAIRASLPQYKKSLTKPETKCVSDQESCELITQTPPPKSK